MWSNQENRVRKQVKNPCEARKIKASQNLHKIISTHLLTWLIIGDIVQLEQRKRDKKKEEKFRRSQIQWSKQTTLRILRMCRIYQMRDDSHLYRDATEKVVVKSYI